MSPSQFPISPQLTAVAIAVKVAGLIQDDVLPRGMPMAKSAFKYTRYDIGQVFTVPDTKVGRRSKPGTVEFKGVVVDSSTDDHALDHALAQSEIDDAPEGNNLQAMTTEWLTGLVKLGREVRVASAVLNSANYAAANSDALTSGEYFDDPDSDPIGLVLEYLDTPIMRPNIGVFCQDSWRAFRTNPKVVKAVHGNAGDAGAASAQQVADLLELEKIVIGRSRINIAKPGQTPNLQPAWSNGLALLYIDQMAARAGGPTYGFTAQTGNWEVREWFDQDIGRRGGIWVRAGEQVQEVISAPDLGFLVTDCLTP
jgi:hypothetical protein